MKLKFKKGFTLVELLISISIIAVLAAVALAAFSAQTLKGRDAQRRSDLDRIKIAVEEYEKDHNCYPLPSIMTCNPGSGLMPYLNKIPCDPITKASYYYEAENSVCPSWYRLYTKLEYLQDPLSLPWCGGPSNNSFNYYITSPNAPVNCAPASGGSGGGGGGGSGTPPPASPPSGGGGGAPGYYGCKGGVCVPILWDNTRPGPECDPNYQSSTCYGQCGPAANECKAWK